MMTPRDIADEIVAQWSYDVHCGTIAGAAAYELLRDRVAQVLEAYAETKRSSGAPPAPDVVSAPDNYYRPDPSYYWSNRKPLFLERWTRYDWGQTVTIKTPGQVGRIDLQTSLR